MCIAVILWLWMLVYVKSYLNLVIFIWSSEGYTKFKISLYVMLIWRRECRFEKYMK